MNIFIISDAEKFGYDQQFQELWGDFKGSQLRAVVLRFHSSFMLYAPGTHDMEGIRAILADTANFKTFSGKMETVAPYRRRIRFSKVIKQYFAQLNREAFEPYEPPGIVPQKAKPEDAEQLYRVQKRIVEFADLSGTAEDIRSRLESGLGRTFAMKDGDALIAAASTSAESSFSAMIGGVMTHPDYRRRGYASACMSALCAELVNESKAVCLFYHNPTAGRIYRRLGFEDIGRWMICIK